MGQFRHPEQVKVVKCPSNFVAHKRSVIIKLRQNQFFFFSIFPGKKIKSNRKTLCVLRLQR